MAGFNAEGIVEPLEYTLKPYVDAAGVIKEPTSLQVHTFRTETLRESQRFRREVGEDLGLGTDSDGEETLTADQMLAIMEKQGPERSAAALKRQADMYSALCSGKPTPLQAAEAAAPGDARVRAMAQR